MFDKGNEYKILGRNLYDKSDYVYDQLEQRLLLDPELYPYDPAFFVLFGKIPRQNSQYDKSWIDSVADTMVDLILAGLFLGMIIGCFFSNTIWFVLAYIRYLQICLHLPMLSIPMPSNVMRFMRRSLPAAKIDVFRYFWKEINYYDFFEWDTQRVLQKGVPDQTVELGYETHNTLVNLSGLAFYLIAAIAFIVLAKFFSISFKIVLFDIEKKLENTRLYRPYKFLTDFIFYRAFLFVVLFGFMEFIIAGFLGVQINLQSTIPEKIQIYFSYIFLYFSVFFLPIIYIYILKNDERLQKNQDYNLQNFPQQNPNNAIDVTLHLSEGQSFVEIPQEDQEDQNLEISFEQQLNLHEGGDNYLSPDQEDDQEKMRELFERQQKIKQQFSMLNFALHEQKFLSIYFYPLYLLRRVLYLLIVYYVQNYIYQFLLMCLLNFISMCYVAHSNPMSTKLQNYVENFNQLSEVFVTLHLVWFTDYVLIRKQKVQFYGLMQIIVICSHGLISLMIIYYWIAKHLYLIILKIYYMFFQKFVERLMKFCWTKSACWRKYCSDRKLDLNVFEISELKPGTQTENDKGGFSANYLIMQKLNQKKKPLGKRKLKQLINLNPKKALELNMPEILEEFDENETVIIEESLKIAQKEESNSKLPQILQSPNNPVNPLDISSQTQIQIKLPFQKEEMKIYGEENDDSDFENQGPIYYDFNGKEDSRTDQSKESIQYFKETVPIFQDNTNQISTIQIVEQQLDQIPLFNQQKISKNIYEKSIFEQSPATTQRTDSSKLNTLKNIPTVFKKESQEENVEDSEYEEGPIDYDYYDKDKQVQVNDSNQGKLKTITKSIDEQQTQNQISSLSQDLSNEQRDRNSIFKQSPIISYSIDSTQNNQKIKMNQALENTDLSEKIIENSNKNQKEDKQSNSDSDIEEGPIYYDFSN